MTAQEILRELRAQSKVANMAGMARYDIRPKLALGVPPPVLRKLAKQAGKSYATALELWTSGVHEAWIAATLIDELPLVTRSQMNRWARDFDSWDICNHACHNLFRYTPFAFEMAAKWARAKAEYVRRAGFSLIAGLAVSAKSAPDARFGAFLPLIVEAAGDDRNMVMKAVDWALRQIGKRNGRLTEAAIGVAEEIRTQGARSARWIAADALRELRRRSSNRSAGPR
jgi:3-methyladenine DNA glycosylase AlkD